MWSIKFLSGPKAGKEILLQQGLVVLGREEACQIPLPSRGISKRHAQILVKEEGVFIEDLDSRNGTFIKGKQIQRQKLQEGDRVALYDVVFELKKKPDISNFSMQGFSYNPNFPDSSFPDPRAPSPSEKHFLDTKGSLLDNIQKVVKGYMEDVVLPGVYKLAEWMEFKWIVGCFVIGFIVVVTTFSSIPLISILKSSAEQESRNAAERIADTLSIINKNPLKKGLQTATTVDYALRLSEVEKAFIISAIDGRVLAPAELAHTYPKSPLIHKARKLNETTVEKMGLSSVLAVVPIRFYNPETGENTPKAYSVVIYKGASLFVGNNKVVSLLIQNLLIACIIGFILFFFLIKLIEFPIKSLNTQFGRALKDEKAPSISINYQSQLLTDLCSHVNSALNQISLNRMLNSKNEEEGGKGEVHRQNEMNNLVEIIGFPSLCINMEEEAVASLNSNFSDQVGFSEILHQPLSEISDSDFREHLHSLLEQGKTNPQEIVFGEIHLNQMKLQSTCQFVMGKRGPAYAIITFMSSEAEEGAA